MSRTRVSVIIPCYNHGQCLPEAVASVLDANRDDIELIVVDDGSTDDRTRRGTDALRERGIHVIRQENKGLAAARNAGIEASHGDFILPLDADNRVRPAYFEYGIRVLDANPQTGVVYGDAEYIGERIGRWAVGPFDVGRLMESNYIDACAVFRRRVWEQNGGFDGTMPVQGAEDWDFWLGAIERGWGFTYVPETLFEYRVAENSMLRKLYASGLTGQLEEFLATKHGLLYRRAWLSLRGERQSIRLTSRRLARLLVSSRNSRGLM